MISYLKGIMQDKVIWKQDPDANIWVQEGQNGEWRRLHNEELHSFYHSPNIVRLFKSRRLRWASHVIRIEESKSSFKILKGKPTGNRSLGRPRRIWEDNIRMDLEEIGINAVNWVDSAQDRYYWRAIVNAALNLRVPQAMELVSGLF